MPESPPLAALLIVLATALAMEPVAAFTHRFVMHGPGWGWHRSHHETRDGDRGFEGNDLFALIFAALAFCAMLFGRGDAWPLYWVGAGMTLYGLLYALVHDGLVHRRWWPSAWQPKSGYLARLVQAHRLHHAVRTRDGCVSFGFLAAPPPHRLAAALRAQRDEGRRASPASPESR